METGKFTTEYNIELPTAYNYTNDNNTLYIDPNLYKYYVPPMLLFCLISLIVNIRVLMAVRWIRRPLSPTLHVSLSLAAADAFTSFMLGIGLLVNSYLPVVFEIHSSCVVQLTIEMYRLSGVIITGKTFPHIIQALYFLIPDRKVALILFPFSVAHLLALSINHYLGILKPLKYNLMMTPRKTTIVVILLWIGPVILFKVCFFVIADDDYWETGCERETFMTDIKFRAFFSCLFFIPIIMMIFFYTHILVSKYKHKRVSI